MNNELDTNLSAGYSLRPKYAPGDFSSYEDFAENFRIQVPPNFNFGFDVVDEMAAKAPEQTALVWCDDAGAGTTFTFAQMKRASDQAARARTAPGIRKGDAVMLIL